MGKRKKRVEKEWETEPNEKTWIDKKTGLRCHIKRHDDMGHLCGYVGVEKEHPLWGRDYESLDIEVHGGLTWSNMLKGIGPNIWWFGFDCAHYGDFSPYTERIRLPLHLCPDQTYRNFAYVERQVKKLAKQIDDNKLKWLVIFGKRNDN